MSIYKISGLLLLVVMSVLGQAQVKETNQKHWPKVIPLEQASLTIYRPELESINGNVIEVRSAFNYYDGTKLPIFGALWLRAQVHIDKSTNKVFFDHIEMIDANFPDVTNTKKHNLHDLISAVSPDWQFNSSLESFREVLKKAGMEEGHTEGLLNSPPNIFYEQEYAELVYVDGEPIFENIDNSELYQYAVNTPYFIVKSKSDGFYYLKAGQFWYRTTNIYYDWLAIDQPPQTILKLSARADEYKALDNKPIAKPNSKKPKLILSIHPSQLIQTLGEPELVKIPDTELYFVENSTNNLLFDDRMREYYVLFSGRWYKSENLYRGNWKFVAPSVLPVYFKKIPMNSIWSRYRISIPGTPEAMSAALDNAIPQTAIIDRKSTKLAIEYDGEPLFQTISGTDLSYALNTKVSVVKHGNQYYAVDEGVWFESESPISNWVVSTSVPEIMQTIPPSSPVYNIRFVYIYEASEEYVYLGYTGGYTGSFLYEGCIFYGTGYQYKPWYKSKYFSRPTTFAFGVNRTYSKSNVTISVGVGYGGYGGYYPGFYAPYGYGYGFGSYGYAHLNGNYEYKKGYEQKPFDPINIYKNRTQGVIATEAVRRNDPFKILPPEQQAVDGSWIPPTNLYTTNSGDVYKQDAEGNWQKRSDGVWVRAKSNPFGN